MSPVEREDEPEIVLGGREQLFHLLAEAAEIEHTLMCSYLYAAFSLRAANDPALDTHERQAVQRWRKAVMSVATEEMTHLLLVANLSIALGGRPHFGRPNFPVEPGYFPSGVVVRLQAFSLDTLDHFIFLERPRGVEREDGAGYEALAPYERTEAYQGLMPSLQDYRTVGHLYDAIRANLEASVGRLGEAELFAGPVDGQLDSDAVALAGVATVGDLASALKAIDVIVEQGEGSALGRTDSHYQRFLAIRREFEDLRKQNPNFTPAYPVANSPVMRVPPQPEDKVFIDDPNAARVLDFANSVYGLIVRLLVQSFGRRGEAGRATMKRHLACAIGLMHVLDAAGRGLASMPARRTADGVHAGVSFTMLRAVDPLFSGQAEERLITERLQDIAQGVRISAWANPALSTLSAQLAQVVAGWSAEAVASATERTGQSG